MLSALDFGWSTLLYVPAVFVVEEVFLHATWARVPDRSGTPAMRAPAGQEEFFLPH